MRTLEANNPPNAGLARKSVAQIRLASLTASAGYAVISNARGHRTRRA